MLLRGINHIALKVKNLDASESFYGALLGMRKVGSREGMRFYSAGGSHHDLALFEAGRKMGEGALLHFCLNVQDKTALSVLYERCIEAAIPISPRVDHNVMHSFYIQDPDGNTVEIGLDIPESEWEHLEDPYAFDKAL